ncbi:FeoA family protein [Desulforamulus aquiferis]|uniref:Ferrous iron transport protein A n=1 Tax=Desulforamulus aquiferis TaxID=1397668 RepID=A0AAW7ZD10_9FIRM|nr:ferrous iron transport protein A [Desulforamulus aquiferis]MDO7787568.1 ferrous iron transport protein A [Desulforamulus aquiferis]RYD01556.1 iron transporter FeoA [Desulforamulus aquiferis]
MITLKDVKPGQTAIVDSVKVTGQARGRFMAMGIMKGSKLKVIKVAPLGDPIEVLVKSYNLSFRKAEAEQIIVTLG